jgi:hypothetical protein
MSYDRRAPVLRGHDHWKTTNPADEWLGPDPEEDEMNDQLRRAMAATDIEELERVANEIGAAAVQTALTVHEPDRAEAEARKAEAEAQRQRDLDAALADSINAVDRHRARLGRKTCTSHDGAAIRKIFDLLRGLTPGQDE